MFAGWDHIVWLQGIPKTSSCILHDSPPRKYQFLEQEIDIVYHERKYQDILLDTFFCTALVLREIQGRSRLGAEGTAGLEDAPQTAGQEQECAEGPARPKHKGAEGTVGREHKGTTVPLLIAAAVEVSL